MLDAFAGLDLAAVRAAWRAQAQARERLAEAEAALARAQAEEDFLRHAVAELDKLNPEPGEEAALDARRRSDAGRRADPRRHRSARYAALSDQGAEGAMRDALRWLDGASDRAEGRLEAALAALNRALIELGEAQAGVEDCLRRWISTRPSLEALEERLFAIRALARKHGVLPDDLGGFADELAGAAGGD